MNGSAEFPQPFVEESLRLLLDARSQGEAALIAHLRAQLRHMEQEVLDAAAHEQARLAEELHDGLCQRLTTISVLISTLETRLRSVDDAQAHDLLARANDMTRQAIYETRSLAHSLYPAVMGDDGLVGALAGLASNLEAAHGLPCTLDVPQPVDYADEQAGRHLYRIAQEAASNALRHGLPSHLVFGVRCVGETLELVVENDGATIDPRVVQDGGGIGLRTMRRRAQMLGGTLDVQARKPVGTRVVCRVPFSVG